jgi:predicted PurR-regulated permease PerM
MTSTTSQTIIKTGFFALFFVAGALLLWQISGLLLIIFSGVLLAILLDAAGRLLVRFLPISRAVATIAMALVTITVLVVGMLPMGPSLVAQGTELGHDLANVAKRIEQWAMSIDAVEESVDKASIDILKLLPSPMGLLGGVSNVLGTTFGALANVVLILAFGVYFALDPKTYTTGAVRLLPIRHRDRAQEVIDEMGLTLRHWLAGKALMMMLIGIVTYIALTLIGVPLALLLAVIAGVTSFVPIIGPAIAGGLMVLVALTESSEMAIWTLGFYLALQTAESYLLMPVIQSKAIDLPAGVVIAAQVLFGILFGGLGVALATPIAAVSAVAVKRFYIEDVLGDEDVGMAMAEAGG